MRVIFLLPLLALLGCSGSRADGKPEQVVLSPVGLSDRVEYGKMYYNIQADGKRLHLRVVNALGPSVFARSASLRISGYSVADPKGTFRSAGGGGGRYTIKGPVEYVCLAFDSHDDGSICGWQLTPCGSIELPRIESSDMITLHAEVDCFMPLRGNRHKFVTLLIRHESRVGDIDGIQQVNPADAAARRQ